MRSGCLKSRIAAPSLKNSGLVALTGLVVGLAASVGAGRLLNAAFPNGGEQRDLMAFALVIPIVIAVTFVATYIPAFQASRINPINALRQE